MQNFTFEELRAQAISLGTVKTYGPLTVPRSYGVYELPGNVGSTKRFRYGNHPIRMRELEREFTACTLRFLFLTKDSAVATAFMLNSGLG